MLSPVFTIYTADIFLQPDISLKIPQNKSNYVVLLALKSMPSPGERAGVPGQRSLRIQRSKPPSSANWGIVQMDTEENRSVACSPPLSLRKNAQNIAVFCNWFITMENMHRSSTWKTMRRPLNWSRDVGSTVFIYRTQHHMIPISQRFG